MNNPPTSTTEGDELPLPPVSRELIEYLQKVFRDQLPDISVSDRELGALIGEQRVIRHLHSIYLTLSEDPLG